MEKERPKIIKNRENEKGAALVMALLMSFLLLIASAGLILETSMNSLNVTDATAEQEAYNAAESGIQSVVYALRYNCVVAVSPCKVRPNPLLDTSKPDYNRANKLNFVRAIHQDTSNLTTTGNDAVPRLSRWIGYETGTYDDRIKLGQPSGTYTRQNGYAYKVSVSDPDNTSTYVSYSTTFSFFDSDSGIPTRKTYTSGANSTVITYVPKTVSNLNVAGGLANTDFGTFNVAFPTGTGVPITGFNRFEISVHLTVPYTSTRIIRGYIEPTTSTTTPPNIIFDSQTYTVAGSVIDLLWQNNLTFVNNTSATPPLLGYEAPMVLGANVVNGTISTPEPVRLLVKSTGYGPRGSVKQLEAIVQKNFFNDLSAPATLTLVGPPSTPACPSCTPAQPATSFFFDPGSSNVTSYSGDDVVSTDIIPPIGTTDSGPSNLDAVNTSVDGLPPHPFNGNVVGMPSDVGGEVPPWMASPANMDAAIHSLYNVAAGSAPGRYFAPGVQPTTFGDNASGTGITFCDGDCVFTGDGGGIFVVTGKLTLRGNFNFNGLIIVTGQQGVDRSGGGTGLIQGNIVVSPYQNGHIQDIVSPVTDLPPGSTFLSPQYDLSGGGNSTIQYNSSSVANGLTAISNFVLGVAEK